MTNTLGLDDDDDPAEVALLVERAFDINFLPEELEKIVTVGEFYDLLLTKIPPSDADKKCASAMAFYRIRSALRRLGLGGHLGGHLTPASDMRVLERGGTKANIRKLEAWCGLDLPYPVPTRAGVIAALGVFVAIVAATVLAVSFVPNGLLGFASMALGFFAALAAASGILNGVDPGKLPADCGTLGDLSRKAAAMNYGRLVKMGARHRDADVWENLTELLSCYELPKAEITRETVFLQSRFEQHAVG
jgi:hypothetical protein